MTSRERPADELANLLTHGAGLLICLPATAILMSLAARSPLRVTLACALYSFTLVLVYACSTLSHLFFDIRWRQVFRTADQACIFLLIAGTYTPVAVIYLNQGWWWLVLALMWLLALAGVYRVLRVRDLSRVDKFGFGVMGFAPIVTLAELYKQASPVFVAWIIAGGACYCVGAIFLRMSAQIRYSHACWHLFVLAGSACHFRAILLALGV